MEDKLKSCILAIKYTPAIMASLMIAHTGLLILNIHLPIGDIIAGSAIIPSLLLLFLSNVFSFCWVHKGLILYSLLIDGCINFEKFIGFGKYLYIMRISMFYLGIFILLMAVIKVYICNKIFIEEN